MIGIVRASGAALRFLDRLQALQPFVATTIAKHSYHARRAKDFLIYEPLSCTLLLVLLGFSLLLMGEFTHLPSITGYSAQNKTTISAAPSASFASTSFEDVLGLKAVAAPYARSALVSPDLNYPYGVIRNIVWNGDEGESSSHSYVPINDLVAPSAPPHIVLLDRLR
jgi:hypothetical protein